MYYIENISSKVSNPNRLSATVVVVAMDRKDFIINAVISAIRSKDLTTNQVEIAVIKNFKDIKIDEKLTYFGIKHIYSENKGLGHKIIESLEFTSGDFILFLEDDDLFIDQKLKRFFDILNIFPFISMYHNSYKNVDFSKNSPRLKKESNPKNDILIKLRGTHELKTAYLAMRSNAMHNLSSMAIRRDVLYSFSDLLKQITFSLDHVLFLISIDSGNPIYIDHSITTQITIHTSASNPPVDAKYIESRINFLSTSKKELELCNLYLKSPWAKRVCQTMLLDIEILLEIILPDNNRNKKNGFFQYLQHSIYKRSLLTMALVCIIPLSKFFNIFNIQPLYLLAKISSIFS